MRCLALAQEWRRVQGPCAFAMHRPSPVAAKRLRAEGFRVLPLSVRPGTPADAIATAAKARGLGASWAVVDGYHFGARFQGLLQDSGLKTLVLDDIRCSGRFRADILLNQNAGVCAEDYAGSAPGAKLLMGLSYFLLRDEFRRRRKPIRSATGPARRVLVTLGGSDPQDVTGKVVKALPSLGRAPLDVRVVVGADYRPLARLRRSAALCSRVKVLRSPGDMARLMAWADVAVSGAGVTSLEMAYMGLPSLLILLADNQAPNARGLQAAGCALALGPAARLAASRLTAALRRVLDDGRLRADMGRRGRRLIDGLGPARVVRAMLGRSS